MSGLEIYLMFVFIPNLQNLGQFGLLAGLITIAASGFLGMFSESAFGEAERKLKASAKRCLRVGVVVAIIGVTAAALIPTRQDMAAIVVVPTITNSEEFKALPNNILKKINDFLAEG